MCKVTDMKIDNRTIRVADIKQKYIANIIDAASKCDYIDRVILFGSSLDDRCREDSDIDLAIFGNQTEYKALTSKKYARFAKQLYAFDDYNQAYDLLYFKTGSKDHSALMNDIRHGEELYVRN